MGMIICINAELINYMNKNIIAFLTMIAVSEGTQIIGSQQGYDVIVTSTPEKPILFTSYADHPRRLMHCGRVLTSTAAGRYQILARFYDAYKSPLKLPDFSHESQDKIALQMISECNALHLINAGDFVGAVKACKSRWASFPDSGNNQHENKMAMLLVG